MNLVLVLIASIILQFTAAALALRLIWVTKKRLAWALIAAGIFLMALRRCISLYQLLSGAVPNPWDQTFELVGLATSALMVVGIAWIAPLFLAIKSSEEALRLNESRLEALWQLSQMTEASLNQITDFALEAGVRLTNSQTGYLAFVNETETALTLHSWSKGPLAPGAAAETPIIYTLEDTGLWGEAVRQRQPIMVNEQVAPNPVRRDYPEEEIAVRRHLDIPVFHGERIVAVAGVGNKEGKYDEADVRQLTLLMDGMWRLIQRKRSEEALTAEIERMHRFDAKLIQTSNDGIIANDRAGHIIIFNEGAERILGYRKEEVIGKITVDQIYPAGLAREIKRKIYSPQFGGPGELVLYETVAVAKTGELIPVEVSASLIFEDEREVGTVGFFRDLRERQQLRERLLQSERLAVLGQMAAHLSHEIKNPLMLIGGFARQLLKDQAEEPPKQREKLQIIVDEVRRLEDFLTEVGTYAKLSEPHLSLGDVNALIRETCLRLEPSLQESGIKLVLELDSEIPQVHFDPVHLRQVILNIAKNGMEAMRPGGILTITSGQQPGRVLVQIADTGKGIAPDSLDKIFQPFYSTKPKGTGLGLTISQKIMEAHQGEISIASELNRGSRVTISLRAAP